MCSLVITVFNQNKKRFLLTDSQLGVSRQIITLNAEYQASEKYIPGIIRLNSPTLIVPRSDPKHLANKRKLALEYASSTPNGLTDCCGDVPYWTLDLIRKRRRQGKEPVLVPSFVPALSASEKDDDMNYLRMMTSEAVEEEGDESGETYFTNGPPVKIGNGVENMSIDLLPPRPMQSTTSEFLQHHSHDAFGTHSIQ